MTAVQACMAYILAVQEVDRVVIGVDGVNHLNEILASCHHSLAALPDLDQYVDAKLIDPSCWSQL